MAVKWQKSLVSDGASWWPQSIKKRRVRIAKDGEDPSAKHITYKVVLVRGCGKWHEAITSINQSVLGGMNDGMRE